MSGGLNYFNKENIIAIIVASGSSSELYLEHCRLGIYFSQHLIPCSVIHVSLESIIEVLFLLEFSVVCLNYLN